MSDLKQTKNTKSKSRKSLGKGHTSTKFGNGNDRNNNNSYSSTNISHQVSGQPIAMHSSIIGQMDMENLKQATFKNIKSSLGTPSAREECINYALEMVISNLIINGRLDPARAQNMRTPLMKAQIASICDKMLKNRAKKTIGSNKSSTGGAKKAKPQGARVKQKPQKWALQPAALPITIVTDQNITHGGIIDGSEQPKIMVKKLSTTSFKAYGVASIENLKKKGKKKKSLDSSPTNFLPQPLELNQQPQLRQGTQVQQQQPQLKVELPVTPPALMLSGSRTSLQASSEVPSYHSMEYNSQPDVEINKRGGTGKQPTSKPETRTVQFEGSVIAKFEDENKNERDPSPPALVAEDNSNNNKAKGDRFSFSPVPFSAESRCHSAGAESSPSSTKTLNALISSSNSSLNANSNGYQILVDMKGFYNDEVSMDVNVEGRQLIFFASRPKRNDLNIRKVTEIVDVPAGVNLENLKIGRRVDGYVIVEEFDAEQQ